MNIEAILGVLVLCVLAVNATVWLVIGRRMSQGVDLLPYVPRRLVPWDGLRVALAFLIYLGLTAALVLPVARMLVEANDATRLTAGLIATAVGHLAAVLVIAKLLSDACGATGRDLGLSGGTFLGDVRLGAITFLAVAPPVYLLQTLLARFSDQKHGVIEMLEENQTPMLFAAAAFVAVIVAPIAEEFLFRVVLQGWLERRFDIGSPDAARIVEAEQFDSDSSADQAAAEEPSLETSPLAANNPYESPQSPPAQWPLAARQTAAIRGPEIVPIVISSAVFAAFHIGQGMAPVSLFFLALALGFLYQRTHRIVPCITVHLLLNGTSMTLLWLFLKYDLMNP
ncbi:MAG: CPBP family intramembrane glutamic endopeptidase [Pirellulales bacterium]